MSKKKNEGNQGPAPARSPQIIGYARVSTKAQCLDVQEIALKEAKCDLIFSDHGISGSKASRPELDRALAHLQKGDTLVVYKLDRLGRSVSHLGELMDHFQAHNINFKSLTEGIDTSSAFGKLVFHIMSAFAEFTRDLIYENTMDGLAAAREKGVKLGRPRKLSDADVQAIYERMHENDDPIEVMARFYDVSTATLKRGLERNELRSCCV